MYCKKCGTENSNEAKFCKECGAVLEQDTNEPSEKEEASTVKKKRTKLWAAIGIVIVLAAVAAGVFLSAKTVKEKKTGTSDQDYQDYISQAEKYLEELDYENAEDSYLKAIEIDPKQEEPYLELADIYLTQEEYDKAVEILRQAEEAVGKADSDTKEQEQADAENSSEISKKLQEIEERGEYTWVVEPTIEADDINYVTDTGYSSKSRNGINLQFESPYAVIQADDAMGLIDMDGNMKAELAYKNIFCFGGERYMLHSISPASVDELPPGFAANDSWDLYLIENDEIVLAEGLGSGGPGCFAFYWYNGLHHVDESFYWASDITTPTSAIPVQQSNQLYSEDAGDALQWWMDLDGKYAICKDNQLVTDFIYDKCGSLSDGLFAVCQDGKWGYVDEQGEIIIPIEYDTSWNKEIEQINGTYREKKPTEEYCYAASGGYVPLVKDGKWELRDTQGNLIILPGVFEAIRPVYEGKCWVKKDGKWGVIQVKWDTENKSDSSSENEELNENDESSNSNYPSQQKYWVIFTEGYRNGRIEMSTFDSSVPQDQLYIIWDKSLLLNNDLGMSRCNQYRLTEEKQWEQIGTYSILTDYAVNVIASNLDIYDTDGNLILKKSDSFQSGYDRCLGSD